MQNSTTGIVINKQTICYLEGATGEAGIQAEKDKASIRTEDSIKQELKEQGYVDDNNDGVYTKTEKTQTIKVNANDLNQ